MKNTKSGKASPLEWALRTFAILLVWVIFPTACQDNPYKQGKILYQNFCANCHMDDGTGLQGVIPPLAGADYLALSGARSACVIRYGLEGEIVVNGKTYNQAMAGIDVLTEFEIANVINYIHHAWGNDFGYVKMEDIRSALDSCRQE